MKSLIKSILFLLVISVEPSFSKIIRRYYYTGYLYEQFTQNSPKIDYSDTSPDEWKDLNSLTEKHGLKNKGMFCSNGVGAWMSYPKPNFDHGSLVYQLIVGEQCLPADTINSIQPIGYIYGKQKSGIAYFSTTYFASEATIIGKGSTSADMKSLIYIGSQPWTLEGTGKKGAVSVCLMREHALDKVCILPDLANELGLTSPKVTLKKDCEKDLKHYYLQTCYTEGTHRVIHEYNFGQKMMKGICTSDDQGNDASKFSSLMEIWSSRISNGAEQYGTIPIKNHDAQYKVDFLMEIIDIFALSCPRVSQLYLSVLGNIFLMHMNEVWKNPSTGMTKPDQNWIEVWDFLQHCGVAVTSGKSVSQSQHLNIQCRPDDPSLMKNEHEELAMELMHQGDSFDTVIEQIWLILNFVSPYCSNIDGYRNNLWNDFPALFKNTFLLPVEQQWLNPGDWMQLYPSMLSGFDIKDQHEGIISCVQSALRVTPFLDPVGRTHAFDAIFWKDPAPTPGENVTLSVVEEPGTTDVESLDDGNDSPTETENSDKNDLNSSGRSVVYRPGKKRGRKVKGRKVGRKGKSMRKKGLKKRGRRVGKGLRKRGRGMGNGKRGRRIGSGRGRKIGKRPLIQTNETMEVKKAEENLMSIGPVNPVVPVVEG